LSVKYSPTIHIHAEDREQFKKVFQETSAEQLIEWMFDHKKDTYDACNKEDWLCQPCLEKFMVDHFYYSWYFHQRYEFHKERLENKRLRGLKFGVLTYLPDTQLY